jgi:phosphoglycerate dehydrogenase-like enzyme
MARSLRVLFLTNRGRRHQAAALEAAPPGLDVTMARRPSREDLLRLLPDVDFVVSERSGEVDALMMAAAPRLRLIQRLGSLTYDIDLAAARAAGIAVSAWPVRPAIMVAEHVLLQMLFVARQLKDLAAVANEAADWGLPSRRTDEDIFAYDWSLRPDIEGLYERTVGILGFGEIGAELARRLAGLAPACILYHKRRPLPPRAEEELRISYASLEQLVAESDFVCNLLPYSAETDGLIDARFLAAMKQGAFLVSAGSGSVVDEAALAAALRAGHLGGAALDTFEWEPIRPDNPLLPLARDPRANVLLTPHVAAGGWKDSARRTERRQDYENILRLLDGRPLLHRVA